VGKIVCATRGGEASYRTQDRAIALARDGGRELFFVTVVDTNFLNHTAAPLVIDVETRLEKMGRFQLAVALERAAVQGVVAQAVLRQGRLVEELAAVARELGAGLIVLGRPVNRNAVFDETEIRALAEDLAEQTDAEVRIV
jgi:nucleotide-binding universal stress UspA family protein